MKKSKCHRKLLLIGLISGLVNGLFGSGGGTILVPCLVFIMDVEDHKAHATAIAIILPLSILSSIIYYRYNVVDFTLTAKVAIGSVLGGIIGSMLLNKLSVNVLRKFFGIVMIIAAVRMVL
ncbi:MAG: permease [Clostridiales bacterium GWB2_37_7]|nr:MAG: permease [Clostridiales bacterium GWB2_37_7]